MAIICGVIYAKSSENPSQSNRFFLLETNNRMKMVGFGTVGWRWRFAGWDREIEGVRVALFWAFLYVNIVFVDGNLQRDIRSVWFRPPTCVFFFVTIYIYIYICMSTCFCGYPAVCFAWSIIMHVRETRYRHACVLAKLQTHKVSTNSDVLHTHMF